MKVILDNLFRLQTMDLAGKRRDDAQTATLRAGIPEGMLTSYDRARARGRKGIALLRNNVCTNCRMQVPIAVAASLMGGTIEVCGNCGLYLCLPEPEQATPAASAPSTPVREVKPRRKKKTVSLISPELPAS